MTWFPSKSGIIRGLRDLLLVLSVVGFLTGLTVMAAGVSPPDVLTAFVSGAFGTWARIGHVIKVFIPMALCACGLLFTFRVGLWNIGVEGQMIMGAVLTTGTLRVLEGVLPGQASLVLSLLTAAAGGGAWALLAGLLKTRGGINEIFAGLGLNFVAQGLTIWLIFGPWRQPGVASMSGTETLPRDLWLQLTTPLNIPVPALILTAAAIPITFFLLSRTRLGLHLKAIGNNPEASRLFGMNVHTTMLIAMMLGGGLAGIAGWVQVVGVYHRLIPAISSNYGYLGLMVVLLADFRAFLIPAISFFFAALNIGSIQLPMRFQMDSSLGGVIQGGLVLTTLAIQGFRARRSAREEEIPLDE